MSIYQPCEARPDVPCYSWIGLKEVAFRTSEGATVGPIQACATHRRWLEVHVLGEWIEPALARLSEDGQLALRDEQDAEDIIDSDGRLLPRGLR